MVWAAIMTLEIGSISCRPKEVDGIVRSVQGRFAIRALAVKQCVQNAPNLSRIDVKVSWRSALVAYFLGQG
jgi:hypothetical protein